MSTVPDAQPKPTAADYDADDHPLQYAFDLVAHTLHRPGCDHRTGGPADCDSRAMTAVAALRDAGLLATAEHDAQVLRDAAAWLGHAKGCHPDPDRDPYYGCECRVSLLYARAARIEAGDPT